MYLTLLNIMTDYMGVVQGTMPYSVCEVLATLGCVFVFLIPFIVVYKIICMLVG